MFQRIRSWFAARRPSESGFTCDVCGHHEIQDGFCLRCYPPTPAPLYPRMTMSAMLVQLRRSKAPSDLRWNYPRTEAEREVRMAQLEVERDDARALVKALTERLVRLQQGELRV